MKTTDYSIITWFLLFCFFPSFALVITKYSPFFLSARRKTTLKMIVNAKSLHWHYRHTVQPCVCYYFLLFFLACTLYVGVSANLRKIDVYPCPYWYRRPVSLIHSPTSSFRFVLLFSYFLLLFLSSLLVLPSCSALGIYCFLFFSHWQPWYAVTFDFIFHWRLNFGFFLLTQSFTFLWYISTISATTLQSKNWLLNRENYLPSANANSLLL